MTETSLPTSEAVLHVPMSIEDLADWLEYCKEHGYDPRRRAHEVLMDETAR